MHVVLSILKRSTKVTDWLLTKDNDAYLVETPRRKNDTLTEQRHAICKTLKVNARDMTFIGNKFTNGFWFSEWYVKEKEM